MARHNVGELAGGSPSSTRLTRIPEFDGTESLKEAALKWAAAGAAVIPLGKRTKSPGSILGKGWQHQATSDPAQVEAWFSRADVGGVAIECGRSGVVVLDVDADVIGVDGGVVEHTRGLSSLRAHRYFLMPEDKEIGNSKRGLTGWKGDVRGYGGCVAVYPTPHPEGGQYIFRPEAIGAEIPPLPEDVKQLLPARSEVADPCSLQDALISLQETASKPRDDYLVNAYITRFDNRISTYGESRHDSALKTMCNVFRDVVKERAGKSEFEAVYDHIYDAMTSSITADRSAYSESEARSDLERCISWAYSQAVADWHAEVEAAGEESVSATSFLAPSRWRILSESDLEELEFPPDLVHESLPGVGIGQLYGDTMAGKTFIALDLAYRVASGIPWFGREVTDPGDVVYVFKEGAKSVQGRARAWRRRYRNIQYTGKGRVVFVPGDGMFSDPKDVSSLERLLAEAGIRPKLILGDTQALLLASRDENDNAEASAHTRALKAWAERVGCLILMIHHTVKSGDVGQGSRGAGAWKGQADSLITAVFDEVSGARRVHVKKYKDGAPWEAAEGFIVEQVGSHQVESVLVPTGAVNLGKLAREAAKDDTDERYLRAIEELGSEATVTMISKRLGVTKGSASKSLARLRDRDLVDRDASGLHHVTDTGVEHLTEKENA